jgi:hypothetical protein
MMHEAAIDMQGNLTCCLVARWFHCCSSGFVEQKDRHFFPTLWYTVVVDWFVFFWMR